MASAELIQLQMPDQASNHSQGKYAMLMFAKTFSTFGPISLLWLGTRTLNTVVVLKFDWAHDPHDSVQVALSQDFPDRVCLYLHLAVNSSADVKVQMSMAASA